MKHESEIDVNWQNMEFYKNIKYYCSKCKFYKGECTLKRIIRVCKKKGLRNVPIQENQ